MVIHLTWSSQGQTDLDRPSLSLFRRSRTTRSSGSRFRCSVRPCSMLTSAHEPGRASTLCGSVKICLIRVSAALLIRTAVCQSTSCSSCTTRRCLLCWINMFRSALSVGVTNQSLRGSILTVWRRGDVLVCSKDITVDPDLLRIKFPGLTRFGRSISCIPGNRKVLGNRW